MNRSYIRGFTLIELLVAMSILAVIMAAMLSAIRTMAQTESRIDQRLERQDELRVARNFLSKTLSKVSTTKTPVKTSPGKQEIPFNATSTTISWVGILPARPNVGGRYFFRLALESSTNGEDLVLRFSPWAQDIPTPDWSSSEMRVLVTNVRSFSVEGKGLVPISWVPDGPWPVGWQPGWPVRDVPPQEVMFHIAIADSPQESLWIFPVKAISLTDGNLSRVVIGGGAI